MYILVHCSKLIGFLNNLKVEKSGFRTLLRCSMTPSVCRAKNKTPYKGEQTVPQLLTM